MQFPDTYFEDEVREGFFISSILKRAWAAQLQVLEDVDFVCRKHHIAYFADWGTLLGAVRRQGYIPWDDDLDICMERKDYNRFLAIAEEELPKGYYLHNIHTNENYSEMFTRVLNSMQMDFTKEFLEKFHGCPYGMGINIFVMDSIALLPEEEAAQWEKLNILMRTVSQMDGKEIGRIELRERVFQIEKEFHICMDPVKPLRRQLILLCENIVSDSASQEAKELTTIQHWVKNNKYKLPKAWYQEYVRMPFENITIPIPSSYEDVLYKKYGENILQEKEGGFRYYPSCRKQQKALIQKAGDPYTYVLKEGELYESIGRQEPVLKNEVRELLKILDDLHWDIRLKGKNRDKILSSLTQCQGTAIQLASLVETVKGVGDLIASELEEYCELIYEIYQNILHNQCVLADKHITPLDRKLKQIEAAAKKEIIRFEVLFLPYKASQWDAIESIWRMAMEDARCEVSVIPIPYFYKNPDGSIGKMQYEADQFPEYVPIIKFDTYDFSGRYPDVIYIQNPYDEYNAAVTVHTFFYSVNLKQYTDHLIYIPPFVVDEATIEYSQAVENLRYCCAVPGVVHADKVIVQSEVMRQVYIDILTEFAGEKTRQIWIEKIECSSLPKMEKTGFG